MTIKNNNLISLLLIILCMTVFAVSAPEENGAEKVDRFFRDLNSGDPLSGADEVSISSADFNSWLAVKTRDKEYIRTITVGFHDENTADLSMDMDIGKVKDSGYYVAMLSSMFEGHQLLKAAGKIKVANGNFTFVINSLSINEVLVTPALIAPLIAMLLPDYNLTEPMKLPNGISDIQTSEGFLTITK
jgi:hypothetical protein